MILSIDIETYSDLDIKKVGGYKYAENAEVLLFAYAWDDEPVQIVDFTTGEELPDDVLFALTDNMVTKCAYNAQFERTVLSHFLHRRMVMHDGTRSDTRAPRKPRHGVKGAAPCRR